MKKILSEHIYTKFTLNLEAVNLLEYFLVSAVSSLLVIRIYLAITGYPQLGGGGLHIAHMLWGGLLMVAAIITMLVFITSFSKVVASILGGVGFGTFIDELGKFITSDNNYFFQPTVALIYVIFVGVFLLLKVIASRTYYSPRTYVANAIEFMKEIVTSDFDDAEKSKALGYLDNIGLDDDITRTVRDTIRAMDPHTAAKSPYLTFKKRLHEWITLLTKRKIFVYLIVGYFILHTLFGLTVAILLAAVPMKVQLPVTLYGHVLSMIFAGVLVIAGIYMIMRNRRYMAYTYFMNSALVSIFLTQFFVFLTDQLYALTGLLVNISVYTFLKVMVNLNPDPDDSHRRPVRG